LIVELFHPATSRKSLDLRRGCDRGSGIRDRLRERGLGSFRQEEFAVDRALAAIE
jgi:hypothetical protein